MVSLIADAVLPIAWILGLGFAIKRFSNVDESFWRGLEWVSYWVLMPSLLIEVIVCAGPSNIIDIAKWITHLDTIGFIIRA